MKVLMSKVINYEMEIPQSLDAFKTWEFSTGGIAGTDFKIFAEMFRKYVERNIPSNTELVGFSTGHYDLSCFLKRGINFVYFSIPDVRFFKNEWVDNILIRTAKSEKDYTGGRNNYTDLENFRNAVNNLLKEDSK